MKSEHTLYSILDSLKEAIAVLDETGFIVHINLAWEKSTQTNLLNKNFIGENYLSICRQAYAESNDIIAKDVVDGLEKIYNLEIENFSMEYPCHTPTKQQWFLLQATQVQNTRNILVSHINITDQILSTLKEKEKNKKLEKKIDRKTEMIESMKSSLQRKMIEIINKDSALKEKEAEIYSAFLKERELNELKSKLISTISHEVRTPLTNIHLSAEILLKYQATLDANSKQKYLTDIPKSCKRISRILENFFFINNFDVNDKKLKLNKIDFNVLIEEILLDLEQLPLETNKRIKYTGFNLDPIEVIIDISFVKQILLQIISNALKYSDETSPIIFQFNLSEEEFYFSVEDFGIGIPDIDKDRIFDSFYRGSNIENKNGVGLGLYIAKECAEICNGRIEFTSNEKKGSKFQVYLPFGRKANK